MNEVDDAARDALERELLGLRVARRVDLEERVALEVDAVGVEEVEVRREGRDAPELGVREAVAGLQDEGRRARREVAELDDLDRPGGREREPQVAARRVLADLEGDLAADLEDRLVEEVAEPQRHPAGDVDEEDLPGRRRAVGLRLDRLDEREGLAAGGAEVADGVAPAAGREADRDGAGLPHAAGDVVADGAAVAEDGGRTGEMEARADARAGEGDLVPVDRRLVERDVAGSVEHHVEVRAGGDVGGRRVDDR